MIKCKIYCDMKQIDCENTISEYYNKHKVIKLIVNKNDNNPYYFLLIIYKEG